MSLNPCDVSVTTDARLLPRPQVPNVRLYNLRDFSVRPVLSGGGPGDRRAGGDGATGLLQEPRPSCGEVSGERAVGRCRGRQRLRLPDIAARAGAFAFAIVLALAGPGRLRAGVPGAAGSLAGEPGAAALEVE